MCGRRKCINPNNGCSPKRKIRLGEKRVLQNPHKTLKNVFPSILPLIFIKMSPRVAKLQKCHHGFQMLAQ